MEIKKLRKFGMILILCVPFLLASQCDAKMIEFYNVDVRLVFQDRVQENTELVNKLYMAGLLTEAEKVEIEKNMYDVMSSFLDGISGKEKQITQFYGAIVDWCVQEYKAEYEDMYNLSEAEFNDVIFTNYFYQNTSADLEMINLFKQGTAITPINLIGTVDANEIISQRMGFPIKVLKPDLYSESTAADVSEIISEIESAVANKDTATLDKYFVTAKDENGDVVTVLDTSKSDYKVVADSKGSLMVSDDNIVVGTVPKDNSRMSNIYENEPGKDVIIRDSLTGLPLMSVRLREFNKQAVENVLNELGRNPEKYAFIGDTAYLVQYPVHYITEIKDSSENAKNYECEYGKTGLEINILKGYLTKNSDAWGGDENESIKINNDTNYLSLEGESSFIVFGKCPEDSMLEVGHSDESVKSSMILLRDYLEVLYIPEVVKNEKIVAFGRKIRVQNVSGNKDNTVFGEYYDIDNKKVEGVGNLKVYELAQYKALAADYSYVMYLGKSGERKKPRDYDKIIDNQSNKVNELEHYCVDSIRPTMQFPGEDIATVDYIKDEKPLLYGITTRLGVFDKSMFSGWINSTSKDVSLDWWNNWLKTNNYEYQIDKSLLEGVLTKTFTFELQEEGIIILDLEVIGKIQRDYDRANQNEAVRAIRTAFVIAGFIVIFYCFALLLSWAVDTNVDLGFNILEKITFGHWVAIKDGDDLYIPDSDERKYVTLQVLVIKTLGIMVVGVLLIFVNIIDIVIALMRLFGGIAKYIEKIISGK